MPNRTPKQQPAPHAAKDGKDVERMRLEHDLITDSGIVPATKGRHAIYCLTVIGTIEGHSLAPDNQKSTKYEHVIPQLAAVQAGRLEDWELEGARSTLLNAYASMGDSQGKLENFYLGQAATGQEDTPELLAEQVRHVTAERIFDAMQTASLDTVYFLKGKETAE